MSDSDPEKTADARPAGGGGGRVLTINGGSSSLKLGLYAVSGAVEKLWSGKAERIGEPESLLTLASVEDPARKETESVALPNHRAAFTRVIDWLRERGGGLESIRGAGHRVVHGGPNFSQPQRVDRALLDELKRLSPYDPEHLPAEIDLIECAREQLPDAPQVACFDTAFHRMLPPVARLLPIPRELEEKGVRRYGFHGLSYEYLLEELARQAGQEAARGKVILAHLGNGASLAAVRDGKCIDTSMAFTPAAGMPMGTRSGDLDPGLVWFLHRTEKLSAKDFHRMVNYRSGLLGISQRSGDMRDLLEVEASDRQAAEAVAFFCYQAKKWIGAYAAALGGVETLVFAGGIGEHAAPVRARICEGLDFLGIRMDATANERHASLISTGPVAVRVIPTNEELVIARAVRKAIGA